MQIIPDIINDLESGLIGVLSQFGIPGLFLQHSHGMIGFIQLGRISECPGGRNRLLEPSLGYIQFTAGEANFPHHTHSLDQILERCRFFGFC